MPDTWLPCVLDRAMTITNSGFEIFACFRALFYGKVSALIYCSDKIFSVSSSPENFLCQVRF